MPALLELQRALAAQLRGTAPPDPRLAAMIAPGGAPAETRLAIYANTIRLNLRAALRATYPVIDGLVGSGFFDYAAHLYIQENPSRSGDLDAYGDSFGDFLEGFAPAASLPYLADVARLERLIDRVAAAPDLAEGSALTADRFGAGAPVALAPAAGLLHSPFPVLRIWETNQPGFTGDDRVELDQGGVSLLVRRSGLEIVLEPIPAAELAFLDALAAGAGPIRAEAQARARDAAFDATACLHARLAQKLLVMGCDQRTEFPICNEHFPKRGQRDQ